MSRRALIVDDEPANQRFKPVIQVGL